MATAGQPGKYTTNVRPKLELIFGWARNGFTDERIAHQCSVSNDAFQRYKKIYTELYDTLMLGRENCDAMVENALYKRAIGFSWVETTKEIKWNVKKKDWDFKVSKKVKKFLPPDTGAATFWLKNRKPLLWKDNPGTGSDERDSESKIKEWLKVTTVEPGEIGSLFEDEDIFEEDSTV